MMGSQRVSDSQGSGDWTTVHRKGRSDTRYNIGCKEATNFFVGGIPNGWDEVRLWNALKNYGVLVDLYIARKYDKNNMRFGFARFVDVLNTGALERVLDNIILDGSKLQVNIARFSRRVYPVQERLQQARWSNRIGEGYSNSSMLTVNAQTGTDGRSYANVLKGDDGNRTIKQPPKTSIKIPDVLEPKNVCWLDGCLIGEAKDLDMLEKFFYMFKSAGLIDCNLKYLGGLTVLLDFGRRSVAEVFLNDHCEGWRKWFSWLKIWDNSCSVMQRIVWLRISGLPPHMWDPSFFEVIAMNFGRLLTPVSCPKEAVNLSFGRICVLSKQDCIINQWSKVCWRNNEYIVRIQEDGDGWNPPCTDNAHSDNGDSDSEEEGIFEDEEWDMHTMENGAGIDKDGEEHPRQSPAIGESLPEKTKDNVGKSFENETNEKNVTHADENVGDSTTGDRNICAHADENVGDSKTVERDISAHAEAHHTVKKNLMHDGHVGEHTSGDRNISIHAESRVSPSIGCSHSVDGPIPIGPMEDGPFSDSGQEDYDSPYDLPDLNNVVLSNGSDNPIQHHINKKGKQMSKVRSSQQTLGIKSLRLRDAILSTSLKSGRSKSVDGTRIRKKMKERSSRQSSSSGISTSVEIEKTINLGKELGFFMDGAEDDLRKLIEGEDEQHNIK